MFIVAVNEEDVLYIFHKLKSMYVVYQVFRFIDSSEYQVSVNVIFARSSVIGTHWPAGRLTYCVTASTVTYTSTISTTEQQDPTTARHPIHHVAG